MRPFALKVFPKPTSPQFTYGGNPYGDQVRRERKVILSKRFTDSELAAEVWRQEAQVTAVEAMGGTPIRNIAALETLHRFATLPHYDEES